MALSEDWFQGISLALGGILVTAVIYMAEGQGGIREAINRVDQRIDDKTAALSDDIDGNGEQLTRFETRTLDAIAKVQNELGSIRLSFEASQIDPARVMSQMGISTYGQPIATVVYDGVVYVVPNDDISERLEAIGLQRQDVTGSLSGFAIMRIDGVSDHGTSVATPLDLREKKGEEAAPMVPQSWNESLKELDALIDQQ